MSTRVKRFVKGTGISGAGWEPSVCNAGLTAGREDGKEGGRTGKEEPPIQVPLSESRGQPCRRLE